MQITSDRLGGQLASPWRRLMAVVLESVISWVLLCAALVPTGALSAIMNREDQNVATAIGVMGWLSLCGVYSVSGNSDLFLDEGDNAWQVAVGDVGRI